MLLSKATTFFTLSRTADVLTGVRGDGIWMPMNSSADFGNLARVLSKVWPACKVGCSGKLNAMTSVPIVITRLLSHYADSRASWRTVFETSRIPGSLLECDMPRSVMPGRLV